MDIEHCANYIAAGLTVAVEIEPKNQWFEVRLILPDGNYRWGMIRADNLTRIACDQLRREFDSRFYWDSEASIGHYWWEAE